MNKELIVFFLSRHVKEAEARAEYDHVAAASESIPYEDRRKAVTAADSSKVEAEALRAALEIVEKQ